MTKDNGRKLSKQELKRKELFEQKSKELENNGYKREDLTMGIVAANIGALVIMLPFILLFSFAFFKYHHGTFALSLTGIQLLFYLGGILLLVVAHEAIHGLIWGFCCTNHFRSIEFGVVWTMLTPYCTCREPLKKHQYIIGAAMPTLILGFLLATIATIINVPLLFVLALLMILGGGGDALVICKLLLHKTTGYDVIYIDHPYELGLVAFKK